MTPEFLTFTALGSYPGRAEIDFTSLSGSGIFLITGATGGGKTTILDAICLALYGSATTSQRASGGWRQMRCDMAEAKTRTETVFVFSIRENRYRFSRRWSGAKSALLDSACEVEEHGEWRLLATGQDGVMRKAEEILGLDKGQFVKVIMLPQGEFRELLTAGSAERGDILARLFDVVRWSRLERLAGERRNELERKLSENSGQTRTALAAAQCAGLAELLTEREEKLGQSRELSKGLAGAREREKQALLRLKQGEELSKRFERLKELDEALARLRAQEPRHRERKKALAELEALQTLKELAAVVRESESELKGAQANDKASLERLQIAEKTEKAASLAALSLPQKRERTQAMRLALKEAEQALARASRLSELEGERGRLQGRRQTLEAGLKECLEAQEKSKAQTQQTQTEVDSCRKAQGMLDRLTLAGTELSETARLYAELQALTQKQKSARAEYEQLSQRAQALEGGREALRIKLDKARRILAENAAYAVSLALSEGKPCPVCGSREHPSPACMPEGSVSQEETERDEASERSLAAELEQVRTELSACARSLEEAEGSISEKEKELSGRSTENIAQRLEDKRSEYRAAKKLAEGIPRLEERLCELKEALETLQKAEKDARTELSKTESSLASVLAEQKALLEGRKNEAGEGELRAERARLESSIKQEEHAIAELEKSAQTAALELARAREQHKGAQSTLESSRLRAAARRSELLSACERVGVTPEQAMENKAGERELAELRAQVESYETQRAETEAVRKSLGEELEGQKRPELESLRRDEQAAREATAAQEDAQNALSTRLGVLESARQQLEALEQTRRELEPKYSSAARLARLIGNENEKKTPISNFVSGLLLDEIINCANLVFSSLTRGQYVLKRAEEASGRERNQGLGFLVTDAFIGADRAVSTLSGGELFLASLSLALGLSDIVQSFSGGIRLNSLFIDEGFGSLDSEALELAMRALLEVRQERLVGIISHVSELREKIGAKILVTKDKNGSRLEIVT